MPFQACELVDLRKMPAPLRRAAATALLTIFVMAPGSAGSDESSRHAWTENESMLLFFEAVEKIRSHSLNSDSAEEIVRKALREYLRKQDPFADYLTADEYAALKVASSDNRYAGVGMDLAIDSSGKVICIPFPGSPAERGGIRYGEVLLAVNGAAVEGRSVFAIGKDIRGPRGGAVKLAVLKHSGKVHEVTLVREAIQFKSVHFESNKQLTVIRILRFTLETPAELKQALVASIRRNAPLVMDLRGNTGGDLFAAMDCASLFLKKGARIALIKTRQGEKWHSNKEDPLDSSSKLYLWQDRQTASAAEVFIAALTDNGRAISIGEATFGKGVAQRLVELTDGSALLLTYATLFAPNAVSFHGVGLRPSYALPTTSGSKEGMDQYVAKTMHLIELNFP